MVKSTILYLNRPIRGQYSSHSLVLRPASSHSSVNILFGKKSLKINCFLVSGPQNHLAALQRCYYPRSSQAISQERLAEPSLQHFCLPSGFSWYSTTCLIYPAGGAYLRFRTKRKHQRLPEATIHSHSEHEVNFEWQKQLINELYRRKNFDWPLIDPTLIRRLRSKIN